MFSRRAVSLFDYVMTDSMTLTDNRGKRMRLWISGEVGMDTLVDRTVGILNSEPVDIYVNPTSLPDVIAGDTNPCGRKPLAGKVIGAAVKNGVAIELNDRYRLPSASFVKMAKAAGAKFTFGTNNRAVDPGRCEYGLQMVRECNLRFFLPLKGPKAIERKGGAGFARAVVKIA
jgi:hypothetical protein